MQTTFLSRLWCPSARHFCAGGSFRGSAVWIFPWASARPGAEPKTVKKRNSWDALGGAPGSRSFQLFCSNPQHHRITANGTEGLVCSSEASCACSTGGREPLTQDLSERLPRGTAQMRELGTIWP